MTAAQSEPAPRVPAEKASPRDRWRLPLGAAERRAAWADMLLHDHGLLRLVLPNRHRVSATVWRSGQPDPWQLAAFARAGGRSVVSLRGGRDLGALPLEIEACERLGLAFHVLPFRSRSLPKPGQVRAFDALMRRVEHPVLLHCKSGCDRAGLASALYLILVEGCAVGIARRQLGLRYGHLPGTRAGILDAFLAAYERDAARRPQPLLDWVATRYRPEEIAEAFRQRRHRR